MQIKSTSKQEFDMFLLEVFFCVFLIAAVFPGGHFELLFKFTGKGRVVLKSTLKADIGNGH